MDADCIIVGGGPAGVLLSLFLARKGVRVRLLEQHADFDRDFRGDTVHASTLEVLDQIGLAQRALALPHQKLQRFTLVSAEQEFLIADLAGLDSPFPFLAVLPQAQLLDMLIGAANEHAGFCCELGAGVVDLLWEDDRVVGVRTRRTGAVAGKEAGREEELRAPLVIAADGRFSRIRKRVELPVRSTSPPMDVAWFRLPTAPDGTIDAPGFHVGGGTILVKIPRPDCVQVGFVMPKGTFTELKQAGFEAFRARVAQVNPDFAERVAHLTGFDEVHLLVIKGDCLDRWHLPGLLLIGDAAHVMTPVGGVGINHAIGDAVEAANVLTAPLLAGQVEESHLAEVQRRRLPVIRTVQRMQGRMQQVLVVQGLKDEPFRLPLPVRIMRALPWVNRLPARMVAIGPRRVRLEAP